MRFAVLGTGHWARAVHAAALAGHPSAQLVGVWGRDPAKAKAVGAEFDVAGYADLDALLGDVDAVAIALPPDVQAPLAVRAAEAGKHLLLGKPIALDVAAADRGGSAGAAGRGGAGGLFSVPVPAGAAAPLGEAAPTPPLGGA